MDLNQQATAQKASKSLMVVGSRSLTFGEQWSRMHALQNWLLEHGLDDDRPVLLAVRNELEQASLLLALILLGKPPLILDPCSTPIEATGVLSHSDYNAIIAEPVLLQNWGLADKALPVLKVKSGPAGKGVFGSLLRNRTPADDGPAWPAMAGANTGPFEMNVPAESLAYVIFTSGTTSLPKGVELSRSALIEQMTVLKNHCALDEHCRILNTLPMHHVDGLLQGPMLAWVSGATVFRPMAFSTQVLQQYMDVFYRDRITHFITVPTMLSLMTRFGRDWSDALNSDDFRMMLCSAGHLEQHLWEQVEEQFGVLLVNMYGLSETGSSALFSGPDDRTRKVGTIGMPVNCEVRLVDGQGADVNRGEAGELLIASGQLMRGYHNNPEATAEAIRDGWLYTGDLCAELESGHFAIVGRKKNQIISGGRNISPEEVASCLNQHPKIIESVVFGEADEDWGEHVVAVVVVEKPGPGETELTDWCRSQLSEFKVPRHILQVDQLEKGPAGKIRLEAARRLYAERSQVTTGPGASQQDIQSRVLQLAAETFRLSPGELDMDSTIENTSGWDSLGHLSLLLQAEKVFSIRFSAREIMRIDSIRKLVEFCAESSRS